jgi:hypothetical protein
MIALVLIALLLLVVVGVSFVAHWLFIIAAVLVGVWMFTFVTGTRNGRTRGTWR